MAKKTRHLTKRRAHPGEQYGKFLADWANTVGDASGTAEAQVTMALLRLAAQPRAGDWFYTRQPTGGPFPTGPISFDADLKGRPLRVNNLPSSVVELITQWYAFKHTIEPWDSPDECALAAAAILINTVEPDRVRTCEHCQKWYFAFQSNQRFCPGGQCQAAYWNQPGRHAEYMEGYRDKSGLTKGKTEKTRLRLQELKKKARR